MKIFSIILLLILFETNEAQNIFENSVNVDTVGNNSRTDNIYVKNIFSDSLASSFCIVIKKEVKAHKHITHSEHVMVMQGEGLMKLLNNTFNIKKGDLIFIPKNTVHSVKTTSKIPLKVISIQAPIFDGKDRVMAEEK